MKFDLQKAIDVVKRTPAVLSAMLQDISDEWLYCKEGENTWSPFDVVGHLIICEQTDFIPRTQIILSNAEEKNLSPVDTNAHVGYSKGKSINDLLEEFTQLRNENVQKLIAMRLSESDLDKTGLHLEVGPLTVRNVLAKWAPHDLNHLAQIARAMAMQYTVAAGPFANYLGILKQNNS